MEKKKKLVYPPYKFIHPKRIGKNVKGKKIGVSKRLKKWGKKGKRIFLKEKEKMEKKKVSKKLSKSKIHKKKQKELYKMNINEILRKNCSLVIMSRLNMLHAF